MTGAHAKSPTPLRAGIASTLWPGAGQVLVGKRLGGLALSAITLLLALLGLVVLASIGLVDLAAWLADPDTLLAVFLANVALLLVRLWSTSDAWRSAGGAYTSVVLVGLLLFILTPHVVVGYYLWEGRDALNQVFVSEEPPHQVASPPPQATSTPSPHSPLVAANPLPSESNTTSTTLPLGTERLTVLLLGGDAGPDRTGLRTDTMIVATMDTVSGDSVLFGLPRNMGGFEFSNGQVYRSSEQGLLNEVYRYGTWYPERFGGVDPGASAVMDVASHMLDLHIDYFLLVDLVGFAEVIDAFGGVEIEVAKSIPAPVYNRETGGHTNITITPGTHHMDGDLALAYARSRTGSSDYDRMGRQRCLLTSFAEQLNPFTLMLNFDPILDSIERNVTTDVPIDDLPTLMRLAPKISMEETLVIGFEQEYRKGYTATGLAKPDTEKIQEAVRLAIADPDLARIELGIPAASDDCGAPADG